MMLTDRDFPQFASPARRTRPLQAGSIGGYPTSMEPGRTGQDSLPTPARTDRVYPANADATGGSTSPPPGRSLRNSTSPLGQRLTGISKIDGARNCVAIISSALFGQSAVKIRVAQRPEPEPGADIDVHTPDEARYHAIGAWQIPLWGDGGRK